MQVGSAWKWKRKVETTESAKFDHSHQDYDREKKRDYINKIENNARQMMRNSKDENIIKIKYKQHRNSDTAPRDTYTFWYINNIK